MSLEIWAMGEKNASRCVVISPQAREFEQYIEKIAETHPHRTFRNKNPEKTWGDAIQMPQTANRLCVRCPVKLGEKRETEKMGNGDVNRDIQDIWKHWKKHRAQ